MNTSVKIIPGHITRRSTMIVDHATTEHCWTEIEVACAEAWSIPLALMLEHRRSEHISYPRMLAMKFLRERELWTYMHISEHFSMDHSSVIHAMKRVDQLTATCQSFRKLRGVAELQLTNSQAAVM
jgi:chromosomal replication initiation ATPase DnaA